ncbi:hypothetical protein IP88_12925 [alpha proteobacterium AAP81b]|nr:hypothetical protein IP88_12925 [alpha proteobacterium AAP81b]
MSSDIPHFAVHDAGVVPWLAVTGYFVAMAIAWQIRGVTSDRERQFWTAAALVLLSLGVNKQLDLQTEFTAVLRSLARDGGWYAGRRQLQILFLIGLAIGTVVGGTRLARLVDGLRSPVLLALAGLLARGAFVVVRAASFHHLDVTLGFRVAGLKIHQLIELAALAIVLTGTIWAWRTPPAPPRRPGFHA